MPLKYCPQCASELIKRELGGRERLTCPDPYCGYTFWDNPTPVVAAIVEYEGDVVLTRNHGWPGGMWGIVAGFLERDESPEEGVLREVSEELGLDARIVSMLGVYPFFLRNQIIFAYHLEGGGELVIGEELAGVKLVPPGKLKPWGRGTGPAVRDWLIARGFLKETDE
jgi:NAD+ diphosphatase